MKTKNKIQKIWLCLLAMTLCCMLGNYAYAQTPTFDATLSQNNTQWYTTASPITGLNAAMIAGGTGYIFSSVYYNGSSSICVNDNGTTPAQTCIASTGSPASPPDIIIGTATTNSTNCPGCVAGTDYILATAFVNGSNQVEINFYDVYDDGVNLSITALAGSTTITTGSNVQSVHIDAIADYNNGVTEQYVVTWCENPGNPIVKVAIGDINDYTIFGNAVTITPSLTYGYDPDVAGIHQVNGSDEYIALVTWVDASGNALIYREYNFTTTTLSPVATLDNGMGLSSIAVPRIDAIDDYNVNTSNAYFAVVAQALHTVTSIDEIHEYDATCLGYRISGGVNLPNPYPSPLYNNYAPTISVAYDAGASVYDYSILHYLDYGTANSNILAMEPYQYDVCNAMPNNTCYWVNGNSTPQTTDGLSASYANATCGAPNDYTQPSIYAWAFYNGTNYEVDYKITQPVSNSYSFKQGAGQQNERVTPQMKWEIQPNPVFNELIINNVGGGADRYNIMDVTGRLMLQDALKSEINSIDVSNIPSGTYIVAMYKNGNREGHTIFVKN